MEQNKRNLFYFVSSLNNNTLLLNRLFNIYSSDSIIKRIITIEIVYKFL